MNSAVSPPRLLAKANLLEKFRFYRVKYGVIHTLAAYIGRKSPRIWEVLGATVTRSYVRRYLSQSRSPMLNVGCGSHCIDGFLNVDIDARADAYTDITRPLPFPNSSFAGIFCEEVLEHVNKNTGQQMLTECWRVLKPGGVLRITTPSLEYFAQKLETDPLGTDPLGEAINEIFYGHCHRHIYSQLALRDALAQAGFATIRWSYYRDESSQIGEYDSHPIRFSHPPAQSHYVEATKQPKSS